MPFPRSGPLVAWGTAYLLGRASLDEADVHTVAEDVVHRVVGVPGAGEPVGWSVALGLLRRAGTTGLRLSLPEPGDPLGLPGPAALTEAATQAGEAAVLDGEVRGVLVPTIGSEEAVVRWDLLPADPGLPVAGLPSVSEAERELAEGMREGIATLEALGLARGRDAVAEPLAAVDRAARPMLLPTTLPPRAVRLLEQATRLAAVVALARADDGAAVTLVEAQQRESALRPLSRSARRALCAGYSAGLEPAHGGWPGGG